MNSFLTICKSILYPPPFNSDNLEKISADENQPNYQHVSAAINASKAIIMLLVVLGHIARMYSPVHIATPPKLNDSPFLASLTDFIYSFHMPAFFAMSGAVYFMVKMVKGRYNDRKKFIGNKFVRLLIPYFFFAFAIMIPLSCSINLIDGSLIDVIKGFLFMNGTTCHLWFLPALFLVFIAIDLLNSQLLRHTLLNLIILGTICIASNFILWSAVPFAADLAVHFLFYFYFGHLLAYAVLLNKPNTTNCALWSVALFAALTIIRLALKGVPYIPLVTDVLVALSGTAAVFFMCMSLPKMCNNKHIKALAKDSYGIYLFHVPIFYLIFFLLADYAIEPPVMFVGVSVTILIVSIALTRLFRKLPWLRVFIGEKIRQ